MTSESTSSTRTQNASEAPWSLSSHWKSGVGVSSTRSVERVIGWMCVDWAHLEITVDGDRLSMDGLVEEGRQSLLLFPPAANAIKPYVLRHPLQAGIPRNAP